MALNPETIKGALLAMGVSPARVSLYFNDLLATMDRYEISTSRRASMFLAQVAHESGFRSNPEENLNYSKERLVIVFPKYFTEAKAAEYAHLPAKIANLVYGGRMGNGPEESGDGYKYRGRGLIQVTGKDNYRACGHSLDLDLEHEPDQLCNPHPAVMSAGWFWEKAGCNALADNDLMTACTKKINGGTNGLEHRTALWEKAKAAFA